MSTRTTRGDTPDSRIQGTTVMESNDDREVSDRFIQRLRDAGMSDENIQKVRSSHRTAPRRRKGH